ncbi:MAG: prolipoprotein diacylglyceryl transferase family protein, partial [Thermoflexales bacterium]
AVLWRLRKRNLPDGALVLTYLALYSAGRFVISIWSSYLIVAMGLNQAQIISVLALAVALPLLTVLFLLHRNRTPMSMQP